jgi:hypothetical protein
VRVRDDGRRLQSKTTLKDFCNNHLKCRTTTSV